MGDFNQEIMDLLEVIFCHIANFRRIFIQEPL
jgi:hypothetical protein